MLEVTRSRAAIISCLDDVAALDAMPACAGALKVRVASDEVWLIGPAGLASAMTAHAEQHLNRPGSYGAVTDATDGWSVLTLRGTDVMRVWERFSENAPPIDRPGFSQGAIAFVPAKAIVFNDRIVFFAPAPQGHHLEYRILHGCADLEPQITQAAELSLKADGVPRVVAS